MDRTNYFFNSIPVYISKIYWPNKKKTKKQTKIKLGITQFGREGCASIIIRISSTVFIYFISIHDPSTHVLIVRWFVIVPIVQWTGFQTPYIINSPYQIIVWKTSNTISIVQHPVFLWPAVASPNLTVVYVSFGSRWNAIQCLIVWHYKKFFKTLLTMEPFIC